MGWLSGWAKRTKITIDKNDIDSALSNFPILVYLSSACGRDSPQDDMTRVFDEVGANKLKIAFTKSDGTTELYAEIEKWDSVAEKAWIWVKVPDISSTVDTDIYIYYDNTHADNTTYIGDDPDDTPTHNVWDSNFKLVCHMRDIPDTSHVKDSTSNNNDGTKKGAGEPAVTTSGKIDDAQDFDGTDDYVGVTSNDTINFGAGDDFTLEAWIKITDKGQAGASNYQYYVAKRGDNWGAGYNFYSEDNNYLRFLIEDALDTKVFITDDMSLADGNWHYIVGVRDVSDDQLKLYVDGALAISPVTDTTTDTLSNIQDLNLGRCRQDPQNREMKGLMDEPRISSTDRSPAWIKASYETGRDHLIDYGSEEMRVPASSVIPLMRGMGLI